MLRKTVVIAQALECRLIVVHPTNARLAQVENKIVGAVDPLLAQAGVTLCWEPFAGGDASRPASRASLPSAGGRRR